MNNRASLQYQSHPSCPILWTLGEANQISSFRSENLPCYRRLEADSDESSPVSGVRLRLLTTPRDLSPSPPLCLDDKLSSLASRWPFVCDDLLIFGRRPLAGLLTLVVLSSSSPGGSAGQTCCSRRRGGNNSKRATGGVAKVGRPGRIPISKPFFFPWLNSWFFFIDLKKKKSQMNVLLKAAQLLIILSSWACLSALGISKCWGRWMSSYLEARVVWLFSLQDKMRKRR